MYLFREFIDFLLFKIGEEFGGCDYMIVIYVYEKIFKDLKEDFIFK